MASALGFFNVRSTAENGKGHLVGATTVPPNKSVLKIQAEMRLSNGQLATHTLPQNKLATRINRRIGVKKRIANGIARIVRAATAPNKRVLAIQAEGSLITPNKSVLANQNEVWLTDEQFNRVTKVSSRNPDKYTMAQAPPHFQPNTPMIKIAPRIEQRRKSITIITHSIDVATTTRNESVVDVSVEAAKNTAVLLKLSVMGEADKSSTPVVLKLSVGEMGKCANPVCSKGDVLYATLIKCSLGSKALYCSEECIIAHWSTHKVACVPSLKANVLVSPV